MRETGRFVVAALALGAIAVWASENFFWIIPHADLTVLDWGLTWIAYSVAAACAVAMVAVTGASGMAAAFLGGAVVGYLSEGAVVGTIYDAFPFQLVWTPLSWHAVITGGIIFGLGRAGLAAWRLALIWTALGLCGGFWGLCWKSEGFEAPWFGSLLGYLVGVGVVVPVAHGVLDRIRTVPRPKTAVLWVAPLIMAAAWLAQGIAAPTPIRLALPVALAAIWALMRRLGRLAPVSFGAAVPVWRHFLFLIAPVLTVLITEAFWTEVDIGATWLVAIFTSLVALIWLGWIIWSAWCPRLVMQG